MKHVNLILLPIDDSQISWAKEHYPNFYQSFTSKKRQQNFLLGRALLAHIAKEWYGISQPLEFDAGSHGKPLLKNIPNLFFNLSHSDNTIALIIGHTPHLGVDVERLQNRRNFSGLLNRTFTPAEKTWILAQSNFKQAFFSLWSAKEAYLKADGSGLSGLSHLAFHLDKKLITGPLSKGKLKITDNKKESLAVYLPQDYSLLNYRFFSGKTDPITLPWNLILQDQT